MKILIAGGSGLVGSHLVPMLMSKGHEVFILTTKKNFGAKPYHQLYWDPKKGHLPKEALKDTHVVINLAGYSIANRWTATNKQLMIDSRLDSTATLVRAFKEINQPVELWLGASASGFYEASNEPKKENDIAATDFLGHLTSNWEQANNEIGHLAKRKVILRIPVVLASEDGALKKMLPLYKNGLGAPVGNGRQSTTWIHVDDLARFIVFSIEEKHIDGTYNIGSTEVVSNKEFSEHLSKALGKPHFLPPVPAFVIKLLYGEMAALVLQGRHLNTDKFQSTGFQLRYPTLNQSLAHLLA